MKNELRYLNSISNTLTRASENCLEESQAVLAVLQYQISKAKQELIKTQMKNSDREASLRIATIEAYAMEALSDFTKV